MSTILQYNIFFKNQKREHVGYSDLRLKYKEFKSQNSQSYKNKTLRKLNINYLSGIHQREKLWDKLPPRNLETGEYRNIAKIGLPEAETSGTISRQEPLNEIILMTCQRLSVDWHKSENPCEAEVLQSPPLISELYLESPGHVQ